MQLVHLSARTRLRFPARSEEFAHGVEVGAVAALMDLPLQSFTRKLSTENLDQVRTLADRMGYRLEELPLEDGWTEVTFLIRSTRARLQLVHSSEPANG
jgi:hypothetical protein